MARRLTKLIWRGPQVVEQVGKNLAVAYGEFGLTVETNAKAELRKGHGVLTGTLRRSIHLAAPGYDWSQDNIKPAAGTPELGNTRINAQVSVGRISLLVGSGMQYALTVHQGHDGFAGYHYLTIGLDKSRPELPDILNKHRLKR